MAFLSTPNTTIRGISVCVPSKIEENMDLPLFKEGEAQRVIASTGIERKRVVEVGTTTSDLCVKAAEQLLAELKWARNDVDCLIFVSSSRDYITPPTSGIIQDRLKLKEGCYVLDIP